MEPRSIKSFSDRLLLGGAIVAVGSAAGLWLPSSATLSLAAAAWCRVAWIEHRTERLLVAAVGTDRDQRGTTSCRAHAAAALAWALVAGVVLTVIAPLTLATGAVALFLALRQADYLALGAARASAGPLRRASGAERDGAPSAAVNRRPD